MKSQFSENPNHSLIEKEKILVNYKKEANEECNIPEDLN